MHNIYWYGLMLGFRPVALHLPPTSCVKAPTNTEKKQNKATDKKKKKKKILAHQRITTSIRGKQP